MEKGEGICKWGRYWERVTKVEGRSCVSEPFILKRHIDRP